jgi:streptogramin lyase
MSERRTDRDMDQMLASWMGDVAPERPPTRLLEETFARTLRKPQARSYPWHRVGLGALRMPGAGSGSRSGVLVLVAVLVVVALGVALVGGRPSVVPPIPSPSPTLAPGPPASPTPAPLPASIAVTPEAVIPVQNPNTIVRLGSVIWILGKGELDRIDPATNTVTASVTLGGGADLYNDLAANADGLWATDWDNATLYRVDPVALEVVAPIRAGLAPKGILANADGVWVADTHDGKVLQIDPVTNTIADTITVGPTGNSGPNWLASGLGSIWVNIPNNSTVVRFSPVTNAIQATIRIPTTVTPCGGFEFQATAVWVTQCGGGSAVAIVDPVTNTVTRTEEHVASGAIPTRVNGGLWVSLDTGDAETGMLVRLDRATNTIDRVLKPIGSFGGGGGVLVLAGSVWVVDYYNMAVLRLPFAAFGP